MNQRWYQFLCLLLLLAAASSQLAFSGNGKIAGVVKDATGAVAPGANVAVEGTTLGAAVDASGAYFILNVPPGTYRVRASGVGLPPQVLTGVRVGSDQIVSANFTLQTQTVGLAEVVVEAQRPPVDKSQTSSRTRLSGDDFTSLPIADVNALVATSASTYKGFVRGGRVFETKTIVDGMDMTDQYAAWFNDVPGGSTPYLTYNAVIRTAEAQNSALVGLSKGSVEEANVLAGAVGSDYNSASAGIISYNLKEGQGKWTARVEGRISNGGLQHVGPNAYADDTTYFRIRDNLAKSAAQSDRDKAARFTYTRNKYAYGSNVTPEKYLEFSTGGSVTDALGLFISGRYFDTHGTLPNEYTKRVNGSVKANYSFSPEMKLNGTFLLEDRGKLFGWKNRSFSEDFRYFLEGVPTSDGANLAGTLKWTQMLSKETFYEVQASIVSDNSRRGYSDDNNDGIVSLGENGAFLTFADTAQVNRYMASAGNQQMNKFFSPTPRNETLSENVIPLSGTANYKMARPGIYYENFTNSTTTLKADLTSQIDQNHQLRGGLQARLYNLDMVRRAGYIGGVFPLYKNYVEEIWNVKPKEYSAYAQDRMEFAGLIINLGLRLDALDLSAGDYANYFAPFKDVTEAAGGKARVPVRGENATMKMFFSPRLGVSHPISERAAMYFSFSKQAQAQPFSRLYTNYNDFGNPSLPVEVRAIQNAIRSTNYELGMQWSFVEGYSLDINTYYKDIQSYGTVGLTITPNAPWRGYIMSTDFGYADCRGVELTLNKTLAPLNNILWFSQINIGGRLTYTYSYVKQAVYAGGNVTAWSTAAGDSAKYAGGLPFADIAYWNTIERDVLGGNSVLTGGYDRPHRITYNFTMGFPDQWTLSSVGTFQSGFYYPLSLGDPRKRELGTSPWNKKVDVRIEKAFMIEKVGRLAIYMDVLNVFDWKNIISYNNSNVGQPAWERTGDPTGGPTINRPISQDGSLVYDFPRAIYFGVMVNL